MCISLLLGCDVTLCQQNSAGGAFRQPVDGYDFAARARSPKLFINGVFLDLCFLNKKDEAAFVPRRREVLDDDVDHRFAVNRYEGLRQGIASFSETATSARHWDDERNSGSHIEVIPIWNLCFRDKKRKNAPLGKLFKNPCSQAELNKIVPFGFSLQRQKWCFFAIKIV